MHHGSTSAGTSALTAAEWIALLVVAAAVAGYLAAALRVWTAGRAWPLRRLLFWLTGWSCVAAATVGPLAAHHDFVVHMAAHLLIAMVAPLFLVHAAPVALLLRAVPPPTARRAARALRGKPGAFLAHPIPAAVLAVGGLWLLYRTDLYQVVTANPWSHAALQVHMLASGYLFTYATLGGPDPAPHRASPAVRAVTLFAAIAAHTILAKLVYAAPPPGVPVDQAHAGAELMYYGAMPVELVLVTACCRRLLAHPRSSIESSWSSSRWTLPKTSSSSSPLSRIEAR